MPSHARSTGGVSLALHDLGGEGHNVLAAHATGFHGAVWKPFANALPSARVVALDFRAHGASPIPPTESLHWDHFADDVLASLDALGWSTPRNPSDRPLGIGHSMGGAALLLAELLAPGTFAALWVYEPITFPPEIRAMASSVENPLVVGALRRRAEFDNRDAAQAIYRSKPPMNQFSPLALAAYVSAGFVDEGPSEDRPTRVRLACRPEDEAHIYTTAATCHVFERLGEIRCPVIVVRGASHPGTPAALAESVAAELPQGTLVAHDELSHFGPMEDPSGLAAEARMLLSEYLVP